MTQRAWSVPPASLAFALLVCLALSTQFLFQRIVYVEWPAAEIAVAWLRSLGDLLAVACCVLAALALAGRVPVRAALPKALVFGVAVLAGAMVGEWIVLWMQWGARPTVGYDVLLPRAMRWLPISAVSGAIFLFRQRTGNFTAQFHESEVTRLQLERQRVAVQLQILQSQIEPHFLFNTLATIRRLQQTDPSRGRETLSGFIHYLKAALPEMRQSETTLGREVDLITAYLDVLRVRMGDRLEFRIDVAPGLRSQRIPPLALATLVENSIKHGIGSLPDGGRLSIEAWIADDCLSVRVADTGVGFTAPAGSGMGLANLRVRLRSLYGDAGSLLLAPNVPQGLAATLRVPVSRAAPGDAHDTE